VGDFLINDEESIADPQFTHQEFTFPNIEQPHWTRGNLEFNGTYDFSISQSVNTNIQ